LGGGLGGELGGGGGGGGGGGAGDGEGNGGMGGECTGGGSGDGGGEGGDGGGAGMGSGCGEGNGGEGGGGMRSARPLARTAASAARCLSGKRSSLLHESAKAVGVAITIRRQTQQHTQARSGHWSVLARVGCPVASGSYAGPTFLSRLDRSSPQLCRVWARWI